MLFNSLTFLVFFGAVLALHTLPLPPLPVRVSYHRYATEPTR